MPSITARFVETFIGGFFKTMKEIIVEIGLVVLTLVFWLATGKFAEHFWENAGPWIWLLCVVVAWHTIKSANQLLKELAAEARASSAKTTIISQYGSPLELPREDIPKYKARVGVLAGVVLVLCIVCSFLVWRVTYGQGPQPQSLAPAPVSAPSPNIAVFAKCDLIPFPVRIPPHSAMRLLAVNKKTMKMYTSNSVEIPNDTDKEAQWPPQRELKDRLRKVAPVQQGLFGEKCEISNHGQVNLLDVAIPMRFWFGADSGPNAVPVRPILSPLDVSSSMSLYMINNCPANASAVLDGVARVQVVGENFRREVPLHLPDRNPLDQVFIFLPSGIRWQGDVCE